MGVPASTDCAKAIIIDSSGNVYVGGNSYVTWGSPVNEFTSGNNPDALVAKLDKNGALLWHTFMGSSWYYECHGIALDESGNVYVTGESLAVWGTPVNDYSDDRDGFVAKLNNSGELQWNTFVGSALNDTRNSLSIDTAGNLYIAGSSEGTWGTQVDAYAGLRDAFAARLNNNGIMQWNTFMGSLYRDTWFGLAIKIDPSGNVYIAGTSSATWGSPLVTYKGSTEAFMAKLNSNGVLQWNTFIGSSDYDEGFAIAGDASGNIYVAGGSETSWGSPVNNHTGYFDAFVVKFSPGDAQPWIPLLLLEN